MITTDLKRVSQELSKLIEVLEPLSMVTDQMKEDALDFSRCAGFVKLQYLNYEYVTDLGKRIDKCDSTDIPIKAIQKAKLAKILTESLRQVNESVKGG
jgi:hypothetical protein